MPLYNKACKFRLLIMNCSNLTAENRVKLFAHQAVISPLDFFLYFLFSFVFVFGFFYLFVHTMQVVYHSYTVLTQLQNVNTTL